MKKKILAAVLACALCVGIGVGGTLAWLTATTGNVVNTFTTSDIDITLAETKGGTDKEFKMVPGHTIEKDPKVTVTAGSEPCYLFVKVEKSTTPAFDDFMTYTIADGWTLVTGETDVYYREVKNSTSGQETEVLADDQAFPVIKDDTVTVKDTVTKADMNALTTTYPTLTITAYATQLYKSNSEMFTVAEAWAKVNPNAPASST